MQLETGHLHLRRMLTHMLAGDETYFFKIDPDTRVWRRFRCLPAFSSMFGTLETISEGCQAEIDVPANVQGGCMGMTRDAAEEMLSSGVLSLENCGVRYMQTWARCLDMHHAGSETGLLSMISRCRGRLTPVASRSWSARRFDPAGAGPSRIPGTATPSRIHTSSREAMAISRSECRS